MAVFCACSESSLSIEDDRKDEADGHFLAVEIMSPSSAETKSGEPGDSDFEEGKENPDENKVNSLRFYFFDAMGSPVSISSTGSNYLDVRKSDIQPAESPDDKNMPNVEQKLKAVLVVKPEDKANVASLLAVANFEDANLGNESYDRNQLANKIGNYGAVQKDGGAHFMMSSSSYANEDGQISRAIIDPAKHLCATAEEALANPLAVHIERVVAKVRLKTAWRKTGALPMETLDNVSYNGGTYTAIKAKDAKGNVIKNGDKEVYILFTGWNVTSKADRSYLIKKVNSTTAWAELSSYWFWNHPAYFRSYWAVNPPSIGLTYDDYTSINQKIGSGGVAYCMENAADYANIDKGTKDSYDKNTQKCNRTQVILAARLVTVDDATSAATPISLAQWGYEDYTEEGVRTAMLNLFNHRIYVKETEGENVKYRTIGLNEVKLVTAYEAGKDVTGAENKERYLNYLKLTKDAADNMEFFADNAGATSLTVDEVNAILCDMPGAKIWHDGQTYYYTDIRHLHLNSNNIGWGYYGVVRNHIYDITIESVTGLGTPVLNPNENIIPQHPLDDKDIYVAAQVNILSWRVVKNNVDLEW